MALQEIKNKVALKILNLKFFNWYKRKPKENDIFSIVYDSRPQLNQYMNGKWYAVNFMSCECCEDK